MREPIEASREHSRAGTKPVLLVLPVMLLMALLALSQVSCALVHATYRPTFSEYACQATLVNSSTGERRVVRSSMLSQTAPGAPSRSFYDYDWDGNGVRNDADVRFDWRRYLANNVLNSATFTGRSWCASPVDVTCVRTGRLVFNTMPTPMPGSVLVDCPATPVLQLLEVTASGLTPDNQFSFPDTPVGDATAPVTFTVTNFVSTPLRVNGVAFLGGADMPHFVKSADTCQPTPAELAQGRGHLLNVGGACTFQLQFRPQHQDGVAECDASSPNESCRRRATLFVTGEVDNNRVALTPNYVVTSGRAIGGSIVTEPAEVCFPTAPPVGSCTDPRVLRIRNASMVGALTLTSARLTRAGNRFEVSMIPMPLTLPPGVPIEIPVRFCNVANDPTDGEYTINSSAPFNSTTVVTLVNPLNRRCP